MDIISSVQEAILRKFGDVPESHQFYLTGGTALSLFYLKHRRSHDLDFFTATEELVEPFSRHLEETLRTAGMQVQRQRGLHSFVELVAQHQGDSTIIHLAQDAAFRFEPTRTFPEYPRLQVDTLTDIASNKLLALFGRAALRDFIDVYVLITQGYARQDELLDKAKQKDPGFDLYWLGVAFERIQTFRVDAPDMLMLLNPIPFGALRTFFDRWRAAIVQTLKPL